MECDSPNKDSYAWKSLFQARHVIELGSIWKVGNGESIKIRSDKWLPKVTTSKVVFPLSGLAPDARVSDLIDVVSHP